MKLQELIEILEDKYPKNIAEDFDNVGLLVGDSEKEVAKILCCLDITSSILDFAIANNVDLVISHHPMIFKSIKSVRIDDIVGRKIIKSISNDISIYALHTNIDGAKNGLNEYVMDMLNLDGKYIYEDISKNRPIRYFELNSPIDVDEIAEIVKIKLNLPYVKLVFDKYYTSRKIKKIALVTGSGMSFLDEVKDKVDLFITGDIKHHDALDSLEQGLVLIDFGHYGSEVNFINLISDFLVMNTDVEVIRYYGEPILKIK